MSLFYSKDINDFTKLAIWNITEPEDFFLAKVPIRSNITHPHKRLQHLAGRYMLPFLFKDFPYAQIEIADTRKPFLRNEEYHFSISHCGNYAAAIVSSKNRVGVDVEIVTERVARIKNKFLHNDELDFVNTHNNGEQILLLTLLWSVKEAMYKWYGYGEVDFSAMMRIYPFKLQDEGMIDCFFNKGDFSRNLELQYHIINGLCVVWITT